eukprot:553824_1
MQESPAGVEEEALTKKKFALRSIGNLNLCENGENCPSSFVCSPNATDLDTVSASTPRRRLVSKAPSLHNRLTLIITTSPCPSHPSTVLLDTLFKSLRHIHGLTECNKIVMCDGYRCSNNGAKEKLKLGRIAHASACAYEEFKISLKRKACSGHPDWAFTHVKILNNWEGFAHSVRIALEMVTTPYVFIIQHDHPLCRSLNITPVLDVMDDGPQGIRYVALLSASTKHYQDVVMSKYHFSLLLRNRLIAGIEPGEVITLIPLLSWYDRPHFCSVEALKEVYSSGLVHRGQFTEDTYGQKMLHDIKLNGIGAHTKYGTYVMNDGRGVMTYHIKGRTRNETDLRKFEDRL